MIGDRRSETPTTSPLRESSEEAHAKAKVELNEEKVASLIGKHLLVGVTFLDSDGELIEQRQVHGRIRCIDPTKGMVIAIPDSDETLVLPPDLTSVRAAPPGEYRLRSTGEVVVDPDLPCTWVWRGADWEGTSTDALSQSWLRSGRSPRVDGDSRMIAMDFSTWPRLRPPVALASSAPGFGGSACP